MKTAGREEVERIADAVGERLNSGESFESVEEQLLLELVPSARTSNIIAKARISWIMSWVKSGRPHVMADNKLAASFMSTDIPEGLVEDVLLPWSAFIATVPSNVLVPEEVSVLVEQLAGDTVRLQFSDARDIGDGEVHGTRWVLAAPWREFAAGDADEMRELAGIPAGASQDSRRKHFVRCVCRYVFGCCAELSNRQGQTSSQAANRRSGRKQELPTNWTTRLSRSVKIDARPYVRDYIGGSRGSLNTQHMRRGHWRNQPYGQKNSLRKFIHIEPCWVGREDVPIIVRQHELETI
jgi:hypothetical protein